MFPFKLSGDATKRGIFENAVFSYRMRWKRRRLLFRSLRNRKQLTSITVRDIPRTGVLVFSTMRNEALRIEHWLKHYRELGVSHFLIVDNNSDDGTAEYLAKQPDVSLWSTPDSYKASRFGVDWLTCLQRRCGVGRWCLTVDADELLIYPEYETRDLNALAAHLDATGTHAFGALLLDMYPKGSVGQAGFDGDDPIGAILKQDPIGQLAPRIRLCDLDPSDPTATPE